MRNLLASLIQIWWWLLYGDEDSFSRHFSSLPTMTYTFYSFIPTQLSSKMPMYTYQCEGFLIVQVDWEILNLTTASHYPFLFSGCP
jgi:hypothetical protein